MASGMKEEWYRKDARAQVAGQEGTLEVDDNAAVSMNDDPQGGRGAYVQAWVWVDDPEDDTARTQYHACADCDMDIDSDGFGHKEMCRTQSDGEGN